MADKYFRLVYFAVNICPEPLRQFFIKLAKQDAGSSYTTVDAYLAYRRPDVMQLKKKKRIRENQYNLLYPGHGTADVDQWDVTLLVTMITEMFATSIQPHDIFFMKNEIRGICNELQRLPNTSNMTDKDFDYYWRRFDTATIAIAKQVFSAEREELFRKKIENAKGNNLPNLGDSLRQWYDENIKQIQNIFNEIESNTKETTSILRQVTVQKPGPSGDKNKRIKTADGVPPKLQASFETTMKELPEGFNAPSEVADIRTKLIDNHYVVVTGSYNGRYYETALAAIKGMDYNYKRSVEMHKSSDWRHIDTEDVDLVLCRNPFGRFLYDENKSKSMADIFNSMKNATKEDDGKTLDIIMVTDSEILAECKQFHDHDILENVVNVFDDTSETHPADLTLANLIPAEIMRMDKESIDLYKQLLNEGKEAVYNIRVMVVGPFGVGKTTLTKRLLREDVDLNLQDSTNGIDVHVRRCKVSLSNGRWNILENGKTSDATATRLVRLLNKHVEQKTIEKNSVEAEVLYERKKQEETLVEDSVPIVFPIEERSDSETNLNVGSNDQAIQTVGSKDQAIQTLESKDQAIQNELEDVINEVKSQSIDATDTNSADLSIWDFAGQYVFYSTHRVFLSERAIYLLVTDISKDINEIVKDDSCVVDCNDDKKQWTVSEFVHFWLNSIHEFCSGQDNKGPPVLLVGTFADQLDHKAKIKRVEKYFRDLRVSVCGKGTFCHIDGNKDFDLDNSIIDNKIDQLRHTIFDIASKQSHWGEHIPAKWITLERKIVSEKDLGKKVLYKKQLRDLNGELLVSIETDEELELFLRFHHESGNILYFSEAQLSDSIVLDPQWLIDAFKSIITEKTFYKRNQTILQNWLEFEKSAKLTDGFLDMVWEKSEFYEHKDLLLRYLQKLGFIVKPQQSNSAKATDYYFVPCILKTPPKEELLTSANCGHQYSTSKLCFKTASGFLPTAVFNQLLAACINKWPLFESNNEYMLYCGFGVFDIEECHTLFVSFYDHEIQMWIINDQEPKNDICANIYTFAHSFVQNDCGLSSVLKTSLKCPAASVRSNVRRFSIDEKEKKVKCNCTSLGHILQTEDLRRCWFIEKSTDLIYETNRSELREQDLATIAEYIGKGWEILGSKLGLTELEIWRIIEDNKSSTVQTHILAMLNEWRRRKDSSEANVCNLYKAMKSCRGNVKFDWNLVKSVFNDCHVQDN